MRLLLTIIVAGVLAFPAVAHHKPGHDKGPPDRGDFFPGKPSGKFSLVEIEAGATCTAPIEEPEGTDITLHGGPPHRGFAVVEELEVIVVSEDPDVVAVCYLDGVPRPNDQNVRIGFAAEEAEEEPV